MPPSLLPISETLILYYTSRIGIFRQTTTVPFSIAQRVYRDFELAPQASF
jgi:hypothetical protein